MDFEEVKNKVEFLEKKILVDFEENLNYLRLDDFYSGGFYDRISDEWFYYEYFEKYEDEIVELLIIIKDKGEAFYELQLRLIKLKREIDNKLVNLDNNLEGIDSKRQKRINHFLLNPKIDGDSFINTLHQSLKTHNFLKCSLQNFKSLFEPKTEIFKLKWLGTELQLTFLVNEIILKKFVDPETHQIKYKLIARYFNNRNGNDFKPKQLSSVYAEKQGQFPDDDAIHVVLLEVSTN